jgi:hypothetical protein
MAQAGLTRQARRLTGMANFLNDYNQDVITTSDYVKSLRLFATTTLPAKWQIRPC